MFNPHRQHQQNPRSATTNPAWRPGAEPEKLEGARQELAKGLGIGKTARLTGLGTGTMRKLKREMADAA